MDLNVISVGDTTLDVFLTLNEKDVDVHCRLDKPTCEICFNYADKIPIDAVDFSLGGNAANNAVAMARLGFKAALYTIHGDDETGKMIDEKMKKEDLAGDYIYQVPGRSSYSTVIEYKAERTILEKKYARHYQVFANFPKTPWMYVSSLGPDYETFFNEVAKLSTMTGVKIGFNPAQLQLRAPFKTYEAIVRVSHLIFMNKEEATQVLTSAKLGVEDLRSPGVKVGANEWFTDSGQWGATEFKKALQSLFDFGPKLVAITDGPNGAYGFDGEKFYFCPIFDVPVLQRTGAGDAFASGFMGAAMRGRNLPEAMKWGAFNAAGVVQKMGPQAGVLTKAQMEKMILENPNFSAQEI